MDSETFDWLLKKAEEIADGNITKEVNQFHYSHRGTVGLGQVYPNSKFNNMVQLPESCFRKDRVIDSSRCVYKWTEKNGYERLEDFIPQRTEQFSAVFKMDYLLSMRLKDPETIRREYLKLGKGEIPEGALIVGKILYGFGTKTTQGRDFSWGFKTKSSTLVGVKLYRWSRGKLVRVSKDVY